jgi:pimeloyl-ACP methyl ester carboxylesterase
MMHSKDASMHGQFQPVQLAYDDTGGPGQLVVLLPGAGDLRSEYRFIVDDLAAAGCRVVTADLPGHGDSPTASEYTVASTADAIVNLVEALDAGPAVVVATSFAPAATVWAATGGAGRFSGLVAISPHLHADRSVRGRLLSVATSLLLRGPWAQGAWARLYTGWYKASPPDDLAAEVARLRTMLADPSRRRAVRRTLTAGRDGLVERIERFDLPSLVVFGSADDHFADPVAEAESTAARLHGAHLIVEGAGHYPHVEQPDVVAQAIISFLQRLP